MRQDTAQFVKESFEAIEKLYDEGNLDVYVKQWLGLICKSIPAHYPIREQLLALV